MKFREGKWKVRDSVLVSLMLAGIFFAFQKYWVKPNTVRLVELHEKTESARKQIEENRALLANVKTRAPASVSPPSIEEKTAKGMLERYMNSNDRFSRVIMGIVSGSKEGAFSLSKIAAEKSTKVGSYTQTLYHLETESSFISIGKFLETLENSPLLTEVESIEISRIEQEMKQCKASIRIYGYVGEGAR